MTQCEMADILHVSECTVRRWLKGSTPRHVHPDWEWLKALYSAQGSAGGRVGNGNPGRTAADVLYGSDKLTAAEYDDLVATGKIKPHPAYLGPMIAHRVRFDAVTQMGKMIEREEYDD